MPFIIGNQQTPDTTISLSPAGVNWRWTAQNPPTNFSAGTSGQVQFYLSGSQTAGRKIRFAIYNSTRATQLAESSEYTMTGSETSGWYTTPITLPALSTGSQYFLMIFCSHGILFGATTASTGVEGKSATYPTWPDLTTGTSTGSVARPTVYLEDLAAAAPTITSVTPTTFSNGQTDITITGTGFGATQGSGQVRIGTSNSNPATGAVTQTVTAWSDTSITITAVRSSLAFLTNHFLFVTNNGGTSNTTGFTVQFEPRVRILDRLIDSSGSALASQTGITAAIWRNGTGPTAVAPSPDQVVEGLTTDGSGNLSLQITRGSLVSPNPVFVLLDRQGSPNRAFAGVVTPTYD